MHQPIPDTISQPAFHGKQFILNPAKFDCEHADDGTIYSIRHLQDDEYEIHFSWPTGEQDWALYSGLEVKENIEEGFWTILQ